MMPCLTTGSNWQGHLTMKRNTPFRCCCSHGNLTLPRVTFLLSESQASSAVKWARSLRSSVGRDVRAKPSSACATRGLPAGEYLVARLAQGPSVLLVESLPGQLAAAGAAGEALGVVLPLHGLNSQLSRGHRLVAEATHIWGTGDTGCRQPWTAAPSHHPE